jgi:AraC family transcriptional regulator, regulatory protein of adaptative response / methylated-DNA-[protein]-cysteine methyltransferase
MSVFVTDHERWQAVVARDTAADGHFLYAVRTTGIYCLPSCPSRPARRENVSFFEDFRAAEAAGYRACKRCGPNVLRYIHGRALIVAKACALIDAAEEMPSLDMLSRAIGLSPFHFHRLFKAEIGITPKAYINAERTRRVREGLDGGATVTAAIYDAGYGSSSRFYDCAKDRLGMTASDYKRGAEGLAIRFAVGHCSLGAILVAATERGVCAIWFGDDPEILVHGLQDRFPRANLIGADQRFKQLVAEVIGAVEQPAKAISLPLDVRGTAFQERVWQALRTIPVGETVTYKELARHVGEPLATRAVANACGANTVAVAIPCHRVVRTDSGLGGYRWGIERKKTLLKREKAIKREKA